MKLGTKELQQKLNSTKDKIMTEIQSVSPSTTHVEGLRNAIQNECHKGIAAVKAEKVRNMEILNDKSRSIKDEFQKLTNTTEDSIRTIVKEATDTMDITLATVLNQLNRAVETALEGPNFRTTLDQNVEKYIQSYPKEMEVAMDKFTEAYFTENDTLEHYIRKVASSVMKTGNSQEAPNNTNDEEANQPSSKKQSGDKDKKKKHKRQDRHRSLQLRG
jgi:hypothetical protein